MTTENVAPIKMDVDGNMEADGFIAENPASAETDVITKEDIESAFEAISIESGTLNAEDLPVSSAYPVPPHEFPYSVRLKVAAKSAQEFSKQFPGGGRGARYAKLAQALNRASGRARDCERFNDEALEAIMSDGGL